ncbi:MAG: hypothetical protein FWD73_04325 [Polyangiaceae bacterium]|nr:hypothetical protein [Polyangiaceae bacterium]
MKMRIVTLSFGLAALALARPLVAQRAQRREPSPTLPSDASKVKATVLRAEILEAEGKIKQAISLLESVKNAGPKNATPKNVDQSADARRARLLLGEYLIRSGRRAEAEAPLHEVIADYNNNTISSQDAEGLAQVGRAAFLLRSPKDANQAYKESERADPKRIETRIWAAELFLDNYDPGHAEEEAADALAIAPKNADALVMMARVKLEQSLDFDAADKLTSQALAASPRHKGALAVRAGLFLRDMDIADADQAIAQGLAINPIDLELLSLKAAARFLDDDTVGFETAKKEVFAKNSEYSRFYQTVGDYAEWEHRYDDIIAMMKEATKIDPDDAKAWAALGLTQMRRGNEAEGQQNIEKAWSKDRFNVKVYNTLNLYEKIIPNQYDLVTSGIFKMRYAKNERAVMEHYVPAMLDEAWASMKARYGFVPTVPVQIEMYSSRQHFSVRTSGLPNLGIQGVCFGHVIAAISPKAEAFNWGNVLWHELGHVFAIQLSKGRVPRWFTEGLSEYETTLQRPEWARELDLELYTAITNNKLPSALNMNRAFTRAGDASEVTVAYYAASQMLTWTVENFGMPRVVQALKLWGQGKKTPEVFQSAFGVTPREYDAGYRAWQLARLSRYKTQYLFTRQPKPLEESEKAKKANPTNAPLLVDYALSLAQAGKTNDAKKELEAALAIEPKNLDAHFLLARLLHGDHDFEGAKKHLFAMRSGGANGYAIESILADIAREQKNDAAMRFHLESAHRFDPTEAEPLQGLYDLATKENRERDALDALRKLAALEQHDAKAWNALLGKLVAQKQWPEALRVGQGAIFVDVMGGATHMLYARALAATGAHDKAASELEVALLCTMKPEGQASAHALLAQELAMLGRAPEAKKHLDIAHSLDPDNADARAVKLP